MRIVRPLHKALTHADATTVLAAVALAMLVGYVGGTSATTRLGASIVKGDARGYFSYLPSLVLDRDVLLDNQFAILQPEGEAVYPYGPGRQGRATNPFPIAPALLWLPGYLIGVAVELIVPLLRWERPVGYGAAAVWGAAAAAIFLTAGGALLTRRLIGASVAWDGATEAVLATWLGTAALYYTLISPLYSHAVSWFSVAAMLCVTLRASSRPFSPARWFVAGLCAGLMVAVRLPDAALLIVPSFMFAVAARERRARASDLVQSGLAWIAGLSSGYLPQGLVSYWFYGRLAPSSVGELGQAFNPGLFIEVLFSTRYEGWMSWTPIVALALIGLVVMARRAGSLRSRMIAVAAILGVTALYLTDVSHPYARPGAAFGARRYVSASPLIALGLAGLVAATGGRPKLRAGVLGLVWASVLWNVWLLFSYERLIHVYHTYPTLSETARFAVGFGPP